MDRLTDQLGRSMGLLMGMNWSKLICRCESTRLVDGSVNGSIGFGHSTVDGSVDDSVAASFDKSVEDRLMVRSTGSR